MRIDLTGERGHARLQQKLLMLLEVHLDARVVPNLDGHGDGGHRGAHGQRQFPAVASRDAEKPARLGGVAEDLAAEFDDQRAG